MKERMCCACRAVKPMSDLIRIARIDGQFFVDKVGNMNGRGAHICRACIKKVTETEKLNAEKLSAEKPFANANPAAQPKSAKPNEIVRALNRSFKSNVGAEIFAQILSHNPNI